MLVPSNTPSRGWSHVLTTWLSGWVRGEAASTRADRQLARRIARVLNHTPLSSSAPVNVYVRDGRVSIYGHIRSKADHAAFMQALDRIRSIEGVRSHLVIV